MVLYKVEGGHSSALLENMNKLRSTCYDISLKIGENDLHAHKNVLVLGSEYFKSLFLGPFADASKTEIDLSATTKDFSIMNDILSFLYTGEIDIHNENLEALMKLSSFFLITKLQEFCIEFISKNLSLRTSMKYYFCALEHGFPSLENKLAAVVKCRFHDFYLYEEETLNLKPEELSHLLRISVFEFCPTASILNFLIKWIGLEVSEKRLAIGSDLLDYVSSQFGGTLTKNGEQHTEIRKALDNLEVKLNYYESGKQFKEKFHSLPGFSIVSERKSKVKCLQVLNRRQKEKGPKRATAAPELEDVIITISPRKYLLERSGPVHDLLHSTFGKPYPASEPLFDVCAYQPEKKQWYHLSNYFAKGAMKYILKDAGDNDYLYFKDKIFYIYPEDTDPVSFHLEDVTCKRTRYRHDHTYDNPAEYLNCHQTRLISSDSDLYVVHFVEISSPTHTYDTDEDCQYQYRFICCKLTADGTWSQVFATEIFDYASPVDGDHTFVGISNVGDEMLLLLYNDELVCGYVASLNEANPKIYQIYPEKGNDLAEPKPEKRFWELAILKGADRFFILEVADVKPENELRRVYCSYEYIYITVTS